MIRYEIECASNGNVIDAPGIRKVEASSRRKVCVVYVDEDDAHAFEKAVEGTKHVLEYRRRRD